MGYTAEPYMSQITAIMERAFKAKAAYEWEELFFKGWVPGCAVQTTEEYLRTEHVHQSGLVKEVSHPEFGRMVQPGPLVWHHSSHDNSKPPEFGDSSPQKETSSV